MDNLNLTYDASRYPATLQDFESIRQYNMVYVDKTAYIHNLVKVPGSYFLSRPRRFGKSMLLSTITAYFEGRRDLFKGLAIDQLEHEWAVHPVINVSLGSFNGLSVDSLYSVIKTNLQVNAARLCVEIDGEDISSQLMSLIANAHRKYGCRVVVLIDEYDKPLNETRFIEDDLHETMRSILRGFYSVLKDCAAYLRFVMITGVTKYTQVSIFSGLNNLRDISLDPRYNEVCGISESEMQRYFTDDLAVFGGLNGMTPEATAAKFKFYYDGYRFASRGENIYNPYSVINAFCDMRFKEYWFETGTPNHLIKSLLHNEFDFDNLEGRRATETELLGAPYNDTNPIGLLYQTGYLTIKDYDDDRYILGFPNQEVKSGFFRDLLSVLVPDKSMMS